jgi:hypothetical protein
MTMTPADRRLLQAKMQLELTVPVDHAAYPERAPEDPAAHPGRQCLVFHVLRELGFALGDLAPAWQGPCSGRYRAL